MAIVVVLLGTAAADGGAQGVFARSPGAVSANVLQVPLDIPMNRCGRSFNIIVSLLNPASGTTCVIG
ncbi:chaplin [Streptomyces sp. NPDC046215]|uniref:chaplin n=1 Tax=Streptomyces TaxID=1883 RepID=UPI0031D1FCFB